MRVDRPDGPGRVLVFRHPALVRITHWINVLAISLLLMSGLQIFNAHPALYWGQKSTFARPELSMGAAVRGRQLIGVTTVGGKTFETTGVLGVSGPRGAEQNRGFPAWATIPSYQDLASGRRWHFFFAWLFVLNGLVYLGFGLAGGRIGRELLPRRDEVSPGHLWREIKDHARLRFPKGQAARHYNTIQKASYLAVILVLLPMMLVTGLSMSPGMTPVLGWLVELLGGRQSARTLHFIAAGLIVAFVIVHVAMVLASGPLNNLRSMVTGRYRIRTDRP
jgi:thiosulfate reductase cytochrome b subunit